MTGSVSDTQPERSINPRERILCVALQGFLKQGYHGTSTLDIAKRAKVSKRDLYAHFGSKQGILSAAISERTRQMRVQLALPTPQDRSDIVAMLVSFGAALLREVSRPEVLALYRLAVAEAERSPDLARILDAEGRGATQAMLVDLLGPAQSQGLIGAGDPVKMAAQFTALLWNSLLLRMLLRVAEPPDAEEIEQRARVATEALLALYSAG